MEARTVLRAFASALGLAVVVAVAACGSSAAVADQSDADASLASFFDGQAGSLEEVVEQWNLAVQRDAGLCMKDEGFDYAPITVDAHLEYDEATGLSEHEWTAQFGYGISFEDTLLAEGVNDPNAATIAGLTPPELELYYATLYGGQLASLFLSGQFDGLPSVPLDEQGCIGEATLNNGGAIVAAGLQATAASQQTAAAEAADQPDLVDAIEQWSRCMGESGFRYADHEQVTAEIRTQYAEIVSPVHARSLELDQAAIGKVLRGLDTTSVPDFDFEKLARLQEFEIAVATQDLVCFDAHVRAVLHPLLIAGEAKAINENRVLLESVRDVLREA